ncbi:hypothetical protein SISNIDRAFT_490095 [Sistotremastrum niveocremeum HHB9708]|uniref:CCHC-type domain-containing protein n=2 Tax=Sistotremastrum niveocremeum HHB9708 TaxID=1314777 RepID=A0A164P9H0_9AGAM|nr:hypothetical protein SISNIDRAFT_490095 [Sistotremastrum niveocremeum HHB9708]
MTTTNASLNSAIAAAFAQEAKLTEDNYVTWLQCCHMFFCGAGAAYLAEDPLPATVPDDKKGIDGQLVWCIYQALSPELRYIVLGKKSGLDCLKAIATYFGRSTLPRRWAARGELYSVVHDPSKPISVFLNEITRIRKTLENLKCVIDDVQITDVILLRLHPSYHTLRTTITSTAAKGGKDIDLSELTNILSSSTVTLPDPDASVTVKVEDTSAGLPQMAQAARTLPSRHSPSSSSSPGYRPAILDEGQYHWCDPQNENACFRCGRQGHVAHFCIVDMPSEVKEWVMKRPSRSSRNNRQSAREASAHGYSAQGQDPDFSESAASAQFFAGVGPLHI